MRADFEQSILQNPALGALCIWQFCLSQHEKSGHSCQQTILELLLVLPMVFHKSTAQAIHNMNFNSGLLKALSEAPDIPIGLSERVRALHGVSLQSINLAVAAKLISRVPDTIVPEFTPKRRGMPDRVDTSDPEVKAMLGAARRLGAWFHRDTLPIICNLLQVKF